jgi:Ca2+-binding RTX toxin-like protein
MARGRAIASATAGILLCGLLPVTAGATNVVGQMAHDPSLGSLTYESAAGEDNTIQASLVGDQLTVTDAGVAAIDLSMAAICAPGASPDTFTCTVPPGTALKLVSGDGADAVTFTGDQGMKLVGGPGNDVLTGGNGPDRMVGEDGDDRFVGGPGADRFDGGAGKDAADYSASLEAVRVTPGTGSDDGAEFESDEVRSDVESAIGGIAGDTLKAGDEGGTLVGGDGEDVLTGGPGLDAFDAGPAHDHVYADDANAEKVVCGDGPDEAKIDKLDVAEPDCENVTVYVPPVEPTPETTATGTTPAKPDVQHDNEPNLGQSVVVEKGNGKVRVKMPNGQYIVLDGTSEIPVGSTVDTREGSLTLTAAASRSGTVQSARFGGGVFTVQQEEDIRPVTVLSLRGGSFRNCPRPRARGSLARTSAVARDPRRVVRRLWGSGHGTFRTVGRHSAASVRGTIWHTVDRCDGTLTRVTRGRVRVADFVSNRFVTVRAGQRYLARRARR